MASGSSHRTKNEVDIFSIHSEVGENDIQEATSPTESSMADKEPRCNWTLEQARELVNVMNEVKVQHNLAAARFKKAHWTQIHSQFTARVPNPPFTVKQLHGKLERWQKDLRLWLSLRNETGVGWDPVKKTFTCEDRKAMAEKIKGSSTMLKEGFPLYNEVSELLAEQNADPNRGVDPSFHPGRPTCSYRPIPPTTSGTFSLDSPIPVDSDECESPQPPEKEKGKRVGSASGSGSKKKLKTEDMLQASLSRFDAVSTARLNLAKKQMQEEPLGARLYQSLMGLGLDNEQLSGAFRKLSANACEAEGFIMFPDDLKRVYINGLLDGK